MLDQCEDVIENGFSGVSNLIGRKERAYKINELNYDPPG